MNEEISRRSALAALGLVAVGCGSSGEEGAPAPVPAADTQGTQPPPAPPSAPPSTAAPPAALSPKELLDGIENIVVLMMENRSFDHFLGALAKDPGYPGRATVSGLTGTESNPAPDGSTVTVYKLDDFTPASPPHEWDAVHAQLNGGKNDGFVKAHAGASQNEVMGYHDRSQIPFYYWLADNFAVCDAWHSSVLGPTWPNRFYLHSCTSAKKKDNTPFLVGAPDTIWERLKDKNVSAVNYYAGVTAFYVGGYAGKVLSSNPTKKIDEFFAAAKNGTLPAFSLIDPDFNASDDHPDHNILRGQAFVASIYKALAEGPSWHKTLFVITYDEHGGFYDHVVPPACADFDPEFEQLGFRVPALVIGPTVKKGYVCKTTLDHTSVAATLRTKFGIADLTKRMANANDLTDCIDASKVKAPALPPTGMPVVAMTYEQALFDGVGPATQPMLEKMVNDGTITDYDRRTHQERVGDWLEHAVRLGAVRIVGTAPTKAE